MTGAHTPSLATLGIGDSIPGRDVSEIRARLVDGVSSDQLAEEFGLDRRALFRLARGDYEASLEVDHPPISYDPDASEWIVPEEHSEKPEPYSIGDGVLWLPKWQVQPWAKERASGSGDGIDTTHESSSNNSYNKPMTNTTSSTNGSTAQTTIDKSEDDGENSDGDGNGETVFGTSKDDFGEIKTESWPSHINPRDVKNDTWREILQKAAVHKDWSQKQIANAVGISPPQVSLALKEHWHNHPARRSQAPLSPGDVDEARRRLVAGESTKPLSDDYGVSDSTLRALVKGKRKYDLSTATPPVDYRQADGWMFVDGDDEPDAGADADTGAGDTSDPSSDSDSSTPPESLSLDDLTRDLERDIIAAAMEHPDWPQTQIAEHVDYESLQVSEVLRIYWPTHLSVTATNREAPFTSDDVADIRTRLLDGDALRTIADDYETSKRIVAALAKGEYSVGDDIDIAPIIYQNSSNSWVPAGDSPDTFDKEEGQTNSSTTTASDADEADSSDDGSGTGNSEVLLEYGDDEFHYSDGDTPLCEARLDPDKTIRLTRSEASKVADECQDCSINSLDYADIVGGIREHAGLEDDGSGTSLTKAELIEVLLALRGEGGEA